jgi:hypothetical protein
VKVRNSDLMGNKDKNLAIVCELSHPKARCIDYEGGIA